MKHLMLALILVFAVSLHAQEAATSPLAKELLNVKDPELTMLPVIRAAILLDNTNIVPELTTLLLIAPR